MASGPITSWQREREKVEAVTYFLSLESKITADGDCSNEIRRKLLLGQKAMTKCIQCVKKQRHHFANKGSYRQGYGLSSSQVQLWELDNKEGRTPKNRCFWTVVLEKTPESSLESNKIKPVILKRNQPWILIGRTDAKAEAPILWPPDANSQLIGKVPDTGKDWRQKEKMATEDEMVRCHHWFTGQELRQILGDNEGQGRLVCCSPWGPEKSDTTWQLNNTD